MDDTIIMHFPGWEGMFTIAQADGAIPNGTRIRKVRDDPQDAQPAGTLGRVLGSIAAPTGLGRDFLGEEFAYFVEWDVRPKVAIGIVGSAIAPANVRRWTSRP